MDDLRENVIEFLKDSKTATVTFCQGRFVTKIKKLAEKYPDEVKITTENRDGSIVAHVPTSYITLSNRTKNLTDEQRRAIADKFKSRTVKDETD